MAEIYDNADAILMLNRHQAVRLPLVVRSVYVSNSAPSVGGYNRDVIIDLVDDLQRDQPLLLKIFAFDCSLCRLHEQTTCTALGATMLDDHRFALILRGEEESSLIASTMRLEIEAGG